MLCFESHGASCQYNRISFTRINSRNVLLSYKWFIIIFLLLGLFAHPIRAFFNINDCLGWGNQHKHFLWLIISTFLLHLCGALYNMLSWIMATCSRGWDCHRHGINFSFCFLSLSSWLVGRWIFVGIWRVKSFLD